MDESERLRRKTLQRCFRLYSLGILGLVLTIGTSMIVLEVTKSYSLTITTFLITFPIFVILYVFLILHYRVQEKREREQN